MSDGLQLNRIRTALPIAGLMSEQPVRLPESIGIILLSTWVMASELPRALPGADLWDFGAFIASARAAREGLNPYGIYALTPHISTPGLDIWNPNLNPPISALLFRMFDTSDLHLSFRVWWAVSVACYAMTVL